MFWPDSDGDQQAQNLRRAIADIRKVIEFGRERGSILRTSRGSVSLDKAEIASDVDEFKAFTDLDSDVAQLNRAIDIYRGPFLPASTANWAVALRMEIEERFAHAVEALCRILLDSGRTREAIQVARQAVVVAPTREDIHISLISSYASAGMSVEALKQYEELERLLDETWGESPSKRAKDALESAFLEDPGRKHNLPRHLTSFVGRDQEIADVTELLANRRLITVTGSGGCGKTRLAVEVARRMASHFRDGAWLVEFAGVTDPKLVAQTVAVTLRTDEQLSGSIERMLCRRLASQETLLVFDNCEHLVRTCAALAESLLQACPRLKILVTSREALGVPGEATYRTPSLTLPDSEHDGSEESSLQSESVRLFLERAKESNASIEPNHANLSAVAEICIRLDGIPLAIELAAAELRVLTLPDLRARIDDRFNLLTGGSRTAMPRHQTLESLVDWSYDLLDEKEQALFRRLSVFTGGCSLDAAEVVGSGDPVASKEVHRLLGALCDKSLLFAENLNGQSRYRMLETIRQYALAKLLKSGELARVRDIHAEFFLRFCELDMPRLRNENEVEWLFRFGADMDNVRSALEWSAQGASRSALCLKLCDAAGEYWQARFMVDEASYWCDRALAIPCSERNGEYASVLFRLAWAHFCRSSLATCRSVLAEAIRICREFSAPAILARLLNLLGRVELSCRNEDEADRLHEIAHDSALICGDDAQVALALMYQGNIASEALDFDAGLELLAEAKRIFESIGRPSGVAHCNLYLGSALLDVGDTRAARKCLESSQATFQLLGMVGFAAQCRQYQTGVEIAEGKFSAGREAALEGLRLAEAFGEPWTLANAHEVLAQVHLHIGDPSSGDPASARSHLATAYSLLMDLDYPLYSLVRTLLTIGVYAAKTGRTMEAARLWAAAEACMARLSLKFAPVRTKLIGLEIDSARLTARSKATFERAWRQGAKLTFAEASALGLSVLAEG
ncbi:MAG: hypothetical protein AKCLJLPJ_02227 [Fimbriimonadales bacterium]|nr:hypothetical protein [Fimbriimonadales bacterium]